MSTNPRAALFSFLRVLAVALASACLPFVTAPQNDEVPVRAIVTAVVAAFLLTVINYLRPGEPRFGPEPKVHDDRGDAALDLLVKVLCVVILVGVVLYVFAALV